MKTEKAIATKNVVNTGMKVKSNVKAGIIMGNHNQKIVKALRVKSNVKAGIIMGNHNQTVSGLRVKSGVRAGENGRIISNHNQTVR
jgi:hypothetical protein